ncbi:MAG TPA: CehA/McbA family metallohydrolase [Vicinamibacterales bacterium]|nr:CehA/McbA family metallohydrolase [Vicinamibacterales bacterium]
MSNRRGLRALGLAALVCLALQPVSGQGRYPSARSGGNYMHNYYFAQAPSSTPWAPAWAPDGRSIAVAMSGSIWRIDPATGVADELTAGAGYHAMPNWSPDGRFIVFTADDGGRTIQLQVLDVASGKTWALTSDEFVYMDPVFSPDGTRLAYVSTKPNGYFNVFVRSIANGQWAGNEVAVTRDNRFGRDRLYFGDVDVNITPAWMPDSKELLIVSNKDVALGSGNVLRVPAVAGGIDQGRTVLAEQTLYRARPDVSIDGRRFIYSGTRGSADQFSNLYVQPTTPGGEPYKLTFFSHDAFHPRWSPDGEWIAFITNGTGGGLPQLALLETYGGELRHVTITRRRWKRPVGVLSVQVLDDHGRATAARIHLTAGDGKFYAPPDAYARVSGVGDRVFHTPGAFQVELPTGAVTLDVVKGFEFHPAKATATITAGDVTSLTVPLKRLTDMAARGWYSGSTHVHMNYAGNLHNTPDNLMMMSAAEDQTFVLEQVANKDNRVLDYQHFAPGGGPHPASTAERVMHVGQEYRPPFYGHVFMFQLQRHLISPFLTGYEGTGVESLYPSNTDMLRKAKAQGATTGYVHAFGGNADPLEQQLGGGKGFIVDAALGTTDALEWSNSGLGGFYPLYAVWNNGLRVTAVGGEDSISSMHASKLVGSARTYVHTGALGVDLDTFFAHLRKGHAFVSTGPLVELTINGRLPGDEVHLPAGGGDVAVTARVKSITPISTASLVFNGDAVEKLTMSADRMSADLTRTFKVSRSGWYHLRVEGTSSERFPLDTTFAQAFTNPVWITVGDQPIRHSASAEYALKWIDSLQTQAEAWPGWRSQREKDHVYAQFEEARAVYRRFLVDATASAIEPR